MRALPKRSLRKFFQSAFMLGQQVLFSDGASAFGVFWSTIGMPSTGRGLHCRSAQIPAWFFSGRP